MTEEGLPLAKRHVLEKRGLPPGLGDWLRGSDITELEEDADDLLQRMGPLRRFDAEPPGPVAEPSARTVVDMNLLLRQHARRRRSGGWTAPSDEDGNDAA